MSRTGENESQDNHYHSQADYLFTRDKKFKNEFDKANRSKRIVPEISGKKKMTEKDFQKMTLSSIAQKSNAAETEEVVRENIKSEEKPPDLLNLLKNPTFMQTITPSDKQECVNLLNSGKTEMNSSFLNIIMITFVAFLLGISIGHCLKFKLMGLSQN